MSNEKVKIKYNDTYIIFNGKLLTIFFFKSKYSLYTHTREAERESAEVFKLKLCRIKELK